MAAEETELTFVRCPNCRSLVPAVATRCRMCGQLIDQSQDVKGGGSNTPPVSDTMTKSSGESPAGAFSGSAATDAASKKGRVRQRTMSVSDSDVQSFKENFRDSAQPKSEPESPWRSDSMAGESESFTESLTTLDAESALHRFEGVGSTSNGGNGAGSGRETGDRKEQARDAIVEPDEWSLEALARADEVAKTGVVNAPTLDDEPQFDIEEEGGESEVEADDEGDEGEGAHPLEQHSGSDQTAGGGRRRRRRRRRKKSRGFGEQAQTGAPYGASPDAPSQPPYARRQEVSTERELGPVTSIPAAPDNVEMEKEEKVMNEGSQYVGRPATGEHRESGNNRQQAHTPNVDQQDGVLVGWFVDFTRDQRGSAREIRSGGFFIGTEQLRGNDLVLKQESVSSPHCLVKVNADGTILIQDLMSQRGTFVRRGNDANFRQCNEPLALENGDMLRVGSYELLVCTIPSNRRRR